MALSMAASAAVIPVPLNTRSSNCWNLCRSSSSAGCASVDCALDVTGLCTSGRAAGSASIAGFNDLLFDRVSVIANNARGAANTDNSRTHCTEWPPRIHGLPASGRVESSLPIVTCSAHI